MKLLALLVAASLVQSTAPDEDYSDAGRIPMVGLQGPEADACPAIGRIATFEPKKGDFMRVYTDSSDLAPIKDRLELSSLVWLCEADEGWQGIVYPKNETQDLGDCRVSTALSAPEPYNGPCNFGWVEAKYIELAAG